MSKERLNAKEKASSPAKVNEAFNQTPIIKKVNDMTSLASNEQFAQPQVTIVNGVAKTTSLQVAEFFGKRHADVLRAIDNLQADMPASEHERNFALMHQSISTHNGGSKMARFFEVAKNGFILLVMGFTGKQAMQFKIAYINRFDEMEDTLRGEAIPKLTRTTITPEQQATLHAIVDRRVNGFDSLRGGLWKRHNKHFSIAKYNQLLASRFDDAVVYLETAELKYPTPKTPKDKINDGEHYFVVKDGVVLWEKTLKSHCDDIPENVLQNPALMLEHIRQVVGEFVGKGALPAPKPTLDIHFPVSWIVENNKPVLKAANTLFNKVSFSLYDLTHPDVRLPTKAILNTLKIAGYCVEAAEAEMFALYNQLSKCRDAIVSIEALTNAGMRQYSSTWPVIPA